jgi:hypothetical protein
MIMVMNKLLSSSDIVFIMPPWDMSKNRYVDYSLRNAQIILNLRLFSY